MEWLLAIFTTMVEIIIGAALLAIGGWSIYHACRVTFWWPRASAQIVRYWITRSEDKPTGQRFFHPVLKFETADGRVIITISSWGSWRRPWPVGSTVSVHYSQANPRWAEIRCFANVWGMPLTFIGLAAIFGILKFYLG